MSEVMNPENGKDLGTIHPMNDSRSSSKNDSSLSAFSDAKKISAEIILQVNQVMKEAFELTETQLDPAARLKEDLGLDSLDAVDMLVYIEDRFKTKVDGEKLLHVKTLQDVYLMVSEFYRPQ